MPAYNAAPWIAESIQSALRQTWPNKEIIVVDDGSKDQTLSVAQKFASKSVTVVSQANQGAAAARNKAFSVCHGEYIQWLDADDLLAPDKIEQQLRMLDRCRSRRTLISGAWGHFYFRTSKAKFSPSPLWCDLSPVEWLIRKMGQNCHMQTANWLVSRELTEAAGPWDTRLQGDDDGEYFCRVQLQSDGIIFVPEAKVFYRRTDSSRLSLTGSSKKKQDALFLALQMQMQHLRSVEDSSQTRAACVRYLQKYMFDFSPERPDIIHAMEELAVGLGGQLYPPRSSWKYVWIEALFGWKASKQAQTCLPACKSTLLQRWDEAMFYLESRSKS